MKFFNLTPKINLSKDFKMLCLYQTIIALADGMIGLFLPIFLFEKLNQSIYPVIIFYATGYLLYGLLVPLGAILMNKIGLEKSILWGRFFTIPFYLCLFFLKNNPWVFLVLAGLFLLFFRLLYWVPYHVDFVSFTEGRYRGRQMAYLAILGYLVAIGAPLLSGFLLNSFSFEFVFLLVIIILIISLIPLKKLNDTQANFQFSYLQTFKELFKKQNRSASLAYLADGGQNMIGVVIWPLFIYQILEKQYLALGAVAALITIGTVLCRLLIGSYTDKYSKKKLLKIGSFFYALGWLAKSLVETAFQIFIIGTFHSFMSIIMRSPLDALTYERISVRDSYIDEYTVLREISVSLGYFLMGMIVLLLVGLVGLKITFLVAAFCSLFVNKL
ncbi:MAG: MFS transporter [Patescibacteria group bacterium]|nr:MFS transporter [Patescibacteria group bacterium]